eukprot:SAG31_NODE_8801_length_1385_cov_1.011664_1_plen_129_part_00
MEEVAAAAGLGRARLLQRALCQASVTIAAAATFIGLAHGRYIDAGLPTAWAGGLVRALIGSVLPLLLGWSLECFGILCARSLRMRRMVGAAGWTVAGCGIVIAEAGLDSTGLLHPLLWLLPLPQVQPP